MRLVLKKAVLAPAIMLCGAIFANAQIARPTEKQIAIQELLNVLKATATAKAIFTTLIDQYSQALAGDSIERFEKQNTPPSVKQKMKELTADFYVRLSKRLREEVPAKIHYDEVTNRIYQEAYDQYFTEAEIKELIAFYKTPTGQRFLNFGPKFAAAIQEKTQTEISESTMRVTREIVDEEIKALEERANAQLKGAARKKS